MRKFTVQQLNKNRIWNGANVASQDTPVIWPDKLQIVPREDKTKAVYRQTADSCALSHHLQVREVIIELTTTGTSGISKS